MHKILKSLSPAVVTLALMSSLPHVALTAYALPTLEESEEQAENAGKIQIILNDMSFNDIDEAMDHYRIPMGSGRDYIRSLYEQAKSARAKEFHLRNNAEAYIVMYRPVDSSAKFQVHEFKIPQDGSNSGSISDHIHSEMSSQDALNKPSVKKALINLSTADMHLIAVQLEALSKMTDSPAKTQLAERISNNLKSVPNKPQIASEGIYTGSDLSFFRGYLRAVVNPSVTSSEMAGRNAELQQVLQQIKQRSSAKEKSPKSEQGVRRGTLARSSVLSNLNDKLFGKSPDDKKDLLQAKRQRNEERAIAEDE